MGSLSGPPLGGHLQHPAYRWGGAKTRGEGLNFKAGYSKGVHEILPWRQMP